MDYNEYPVRIKKIMKEAEEKMSSLPYHNFPHALDVYLNAENIAQLSSVLYEERHLLQVASLLHDIIVVPGRKDNEERSAEFASRYLPTLGYKNNQIKVVEGLILATKMPQNPNSFLEDIICDADLDNLGRADFLELGEKVREELGIQPGDGWYEMQLKFLETHKYHTEVQRKLRGEGKIRNIDRVKKILNRYAVQVTCK